MCTPGSLSCVNRWEFLDTELKEVIEQRHHLAA
jgi:hypothetical protein